MESRETVAFSWKETYFLELENAVELLQIIPRIYQVIHKSFHSNY